jgi:hypothetical protein
MITRWLWGTATLISALYSYGFVPEGVNRHEAADVQLSLAPDSPLQAEKARALAALGLPNEQSFPLQLGAFPAGLITVR